MPAQWVTDAFARVHAEKHSAPWASLLVATSLTPEPESRWKQQSCPSVVSALRHPVQQKPLFRTPAVSIQFHAATAFLCCAVMTMVSESNACINAFDDIDTPQQWPQCHRIDASPSRSLQDGFAALLNCWLRRMEHDDRLACMQRMGHLSNLLLDILSVLGVHSMTFGIARFTPSLHILSTTFALIRKSMLTAQTKPCRLPHGRQIPCRDNRRILPFEAVHPGNFSSRPTPLPEVPRRQQRATFVSQLDACIRIPSRTMRHSQNGRQFRMHFYDDNQRACCALPCASPALPVRSRLQRYA